LLFRATGRAADARGVLGPALAGIAPTSEFPEIAETLKLRESIGADLRR
jgi:hypothetical protein